MNIVKDLSNQKNKENINKVILGTKDVAEYLNCSLDTTRQNKNF